MCVNASRCSFEANVVSGWCVGPWSLQAPRPNCNGVQGVGDSNPLAPTIPYFMGSERETPQAQRETSDYPTCSTMSLVVLKSASA